MFLVDGILVLITLFTCRIVEVDDFIAKLWNIHLAVAQEGYVQVRMCSIGISVKAYNRCVLR